MSDEVAAGLVARWQKGDQHAAAELFQRYSRRLVSLVRSRVAVSLAQRFDPEDVVQSAYRSFFVGARNGRYEIQEMSDLWQLLVVITLRKLHHQIRRNKAKKRSITREQNLAEALGMDDMSVGLLAREPSPLEAVTLTDELTKVMRSLEPIQRLMFAMRLRGYNVEEISAQAQRSECTVRRFLKLLKQHLEEADLGGSTQ